MINRYDMCSLIRTISSFKLLRIQNLTILIIFIGLSSRLIFAIFTPSFYAPDEASHFNYIKYLYNQNYLPVQTSKCDSAKNDYEYYQPPLYYISCIPLYHISLNLNLSSTHTIIMLRCFSIILFLINITFIKMLLNKLYYYDTFINIFVVSMICLLPTYTFLSSVINNDNLVITICGAILYTLSCEPSYGTSAITGLLLGMALLTKLTATPVLILTIFIIIFRWKNNLISLKSAYFHFIYSTIFALLIWSPWCIRNIIIYGSITAEKIGNIPYKYNSILEALYATQYFIKKSFWAVSGVTNDIQLPTLGIHITYFAIIGIFIGIISKEKLLLNYYTGQKGSFLIASSIAILVDILLILRFGLLYGMAQGRFLFTLLGPISIITAIGIKILIKALIIKNTEIYTAGLFIFYNILFLFYSIASFPKT